MVCSQAFGFFFSRFSAFFLHASLETASIFTEKDGRFFDGFCHNLFLLFILVSYLYKIRAKQNDPPI